MKKNVEVRTVTRTEEVITFEAFDGTEFKDEDQCREYEGTAKCAINAAFIPLVRKGQISEIVLYSISDDTLDCAVPFACDSDLMTVTIRNANDVEIINKWIIVHNNDTQNCISSDAIGKTYIFECYDEHVCCHGTIDDIVERFRKAFERHLGVEPKEGNQESN